MLESKLVDHAQQLLDADERVSSAFVAIKGARPGIEALALLPFVAVLLVVGSFPVALVVAVVGYGAVVASRKIRTVAHTDRNVVLLRNTYLHPRRPSSVVALLPRQNAIQPPDVSKGDKKVTIGGEGYWLQTRDLDEAKRMAALLRG